MAYQRFFKKGSKPKTVSKIPKEPSLSSLKAKLQKAFNAYIRKRDTINGNYFVCISCQEKKPLDQMNAGHFFAAGNNEAVRFDEVNVNGQCIRCNKFLHGNLLEYRKGLIQKYGENALKVLELKRHNLSKMHKFEIQYMIDLYTKKIKEL